MRRGKWRWIIALAIAVGAATRLHALDLLPLVGTMEVEFQPMQSAGIRHGCTLGFRVIGQDHAYRKGHLVSLSGNIGYQANEERTIAALSLKIGTLDSLDPMSQPEAPFFAYIQSPHGTTARSKAVQFDSPDMPGFRHFVFSLDDNTIKVYKDIIDGASLTIGFNRNKGGLDVLVPLDLHVAESTIAADASITRRRSNEMLIQFLECATDVTRQVQKRITPH